MNAPSPADARPTVAVLPFTDPAGDRAAAYFAEGFAESLADRLAVVRAVRVAPFACGVALSGGPDGPREIGGRIGAAAVLTGTAGKSGGRIRAAVELASVAGTGARWNDRFDRPLADLWELQGEIAERVLAALGAAATPDERRALARVPTASPAACDAYFQGRRLAREVLRKQQEAARDLYAQAIAADPGFAEAHAALAACHAMLFQYWDSSEANVAAADAASHRALELAPDLADAHLARALALSHAKHYDDAMPEYHRALELHPDSFDAHYFLARSERAAGRMAAAAAAFERACALRPEDYSSLTLLASVYVSLGRTDDGRAAQRRALALAEQQLARHPDDTRALYLGAVALAALGDTTKARSWAKRAVAMEPDDSAVLYNVACVYSMLGLHDSALDCLERAVANGFGHWDWLRHDSDLDPLRGSPGSRRSSPNASAERGARPGTSSALGWLRAPRSALRTV